MTLNNIYVPYWVMSPIWKVKTTLAEFVLSLAELGMELLLLMMLVLLLFNFFRDKDLYR